MGISLFSPWKFSAVYAPQSGNLLQAYIFDRRMRTHHMYVNIYAYTCICICICICICTCICICIYSLPPPKIYIFSGFPAKRDNLVTERVRGSREHAKTGRRNLLYLKETVDFCRTVPKQPEKCILQGL